MSRSALHPTRRNLHRVTHVCLTSHRLERRDFFRAKLNALGTLIRKKNPNQPSDLPAYSHGSTAKVQDTYAAQIGRPAVAPVVASRPAVVKRRVLRLNEYVPRPGFDKFGPWTLGKKLGEGGTSIVLLGEDHSKPEGTNDPPHHEKVAIKFVHPDLLEYFKGSGNIDRFQNEIEAYTATEGALNVLKMYANGKKTDDNLVAWKVLVLQYADYGIFTVPKPKERAFEFDRMLFTDIVRGVFEFHNRKIIHGDINTGNVMVVFDNEINRYHAVLGDLGNSIFMNKVKDVNEVLKNRCGTEQFYPPELSDPASYGKHPVYPFSPYKLDIFSLGATLYDFLVDASLPRTKKLGPVDWPAYRRGVEAYKNRLLAKEPEYKDLILETVEAADELMRGMLQEHNHIRFNLKKVWESAYVQGCTLIDTRIVPDGPPPLIQVVHQESMKTIATDTTQTTTSRPALVPAPNKSSQVSTGLPKRQFKAPPNRPARPSPAHPHVAKAPTAT